MKSIYEEFLLIFILFLFSPLALGYGWSANGVSLKLFVNGGESDAFLLIDVQPLDYVKCPGINWSRDLRYQCTMAPASQKIYVFYLNKTGAFLVGIYSGDVWFYYENGSWIMEKYQDYSHYTVYSVNLTSKCLTPLRNITGSIPLIHSGKEIGGTLSNDTIIFSDENRTWKIPLMQVKPYLWIDEESKYLKGVVLGNSLLIYSPLQKEILVLKNGNFLVSLYSPPYKVAEGVRGSLKPLSVFLYDGKKLEALPVLYWIYDVDTMRQRAKYIDIFYVKGNLTLRECSAKYAPSPYSQSLKFILIVLIVIAFLLLRREFS